MSDRVSPPPTAWRRLFASLAHPRAWGEPLAAAFALGGGMALLYLGRNLTLSQQVVLWALFLTALAAAFRHGWINLFGPVLFYDLVRSARRIRFIIVRTLYALLIAFILCWLFLLATLGRGWDVRWSEMAMFASGFFYTFLVIQFITVVFLTPAYTAGAISEEKERKTIQFLLATDLRNREIIFGKIVSRMLNLTLLLLAGLPILSFLQFLGGVDFGLVLASFAATTLTMFSIASFSILNSVQCRRARDAIVLTYLGVLTYYLLASLSLSIFPLARFVLPGLDTFPSTDFWKSPVELGDVVEWLNAGNIGYAVWQLRGGSSTVFDDLLPGVLRNYALFHGLFGAVCLGWAVKNLRVVALRDEVKSAPRSTKRTGRARSRRAVGVHAMVWKEVFAEGGVRLNMFGRIVVGVLVGASLLPTIITFYVYLDSYSFHFDGTHGWAAVGRALNIFQVRVVGSGIASLLLLAVVVRAAGSISGERDRKTFDDLLTTPLTNGEILFAKWLGAVLSVRWAWVWLGLIWAICLVTGAVEPWCLPLIAVAWVIYAAVAAGLGLWCSIHCRTTLRATVAALVLMLIAGGGHWLASGMFCYFPLEILGVRERQYEWMVKLQWGQTPPLVMGLFGFHHGDFTQLYSWRFYFEMTISSLFGLGCWTALLPGLWWLVGRRFQQMTGRGEVMVAERQTPAPRPRLAAPAGQRHHPAVAADRAGHDQPPGGPSTAYSATLTRTSPDGKDGKDTPSQEVRASRTAERSEPPGSPP